MCSTNSAELNIEPKSNIIGLGDQTKQRLDAMTAMLASLNNNSSASSISTTNTSSSKAGLPGFSDMLNMNERKAMETSLMQAQDHFKKLSILTSKISKGGDNAVSEQEILAILDTLKTEKASIDALIEKNVDSVIAKERLSENSKKPNAGTFNFSSIFEQPGDSEEDEPANGSWLQQYPSKAGKTKAAGDFKKLQMHGKRFSPDWEEPQTVAACKDLARPKYDSHTTAEEKLDTKATLDKKLDLIADIIMSNKSKKSTVVYSGAGLSTAAGIGDYASKAKGSVAPHLKNNNVVAKGNRLDLRPTLGHHALAAMESAGLLHFWVQQNHDRLGQKAGYPQEKMCEIHGAWGDHKNPVVAMSGSLRSDLYEWWDQWCDRAEVCLTVGTSLAGMNADNLPKSVGTKNDNLIIIGLTPTGLDHLAGVRVWGLLDDVLEKLAKKLNIPKVPHPETKRRGDMWISKHPGCRFNTPIRDNNAERKKEMEAEQKRQERENARSSSKTSGIASAGRSSSKTNTNAGTAASSSSSTQTVRRKTELSGSRLF